MQEQPTKEHQWLHQLVGDWTFESECNMGPDQPPMITSGIETVRSLGGLWTIGEGTMGAGDLAGRSVMTLGYQPHTKRFIGTFVASMMTHLWPYDGALDESGKVLALESEGPSFSGDGSMAKYIDSIEFVDNDHRILTSQYQLPSGEWQTFMKAHYHRVAPKT